LKGGEVSLELWCLGMKLRCREEALKQGMRKKTRLASPIFSSLLVLPTCLIQPKQQGIEWEISRRLSLQGHRRGEEYRGREANKMKQNQPTK